MRRTKFVSAVALVSGAALALSACGGGGGGSTGSDADVAAMAVAKGEDANALTYKAPKVESAGTVSMTTDKEFTAYNNETADANNSYNQVVMTAVLARAFIVDGNQKVILNKDVLDSVDVATNPQKVTYKVKQGVTWSDGAPWGCKDFYLSWLARSGKAKKADGTFFLPASTSGYDKIESVTCPDPQTIVTTYAENYPDWKGLFGGGDGGPLPAHILEKQTGVSDITQVTPTSDPAVLQKVADFWNTGWKGFTKELMPASGPYVITDWKQKQSITLERNAKWAGGAKGGPEKIVVKAVPDPVAQAQALENGENQIMASMQPDANAADRLRNLGSQGVKYGSEQGLTFEHLDLNHRNPLLADKEVRKAFFMAVNRKEITDKLVGPVVKDAKPMGSLIFYPGEDGYQDHYSDKSKGSADEAKKILEAAGWKLGGDGVYAKDGQRLSLKISHTDIPRRKKTVELIMSQAKSAGIEIKDDTDPNFLDGRVSRGEYDIALFAWSGAPFKADKKPIYYTNGPQNWQKVSSPAADAAFEKAVTQTDPQAATPLYVEADKALAEEYASLPLFQTPNMWGFKGVDRVWHQSYFGALWTAHEWQKSS
ncbi:peptide/nickel transport system substrate-binding protein [Streptoalloteichus tenebrarius]|uniref:Peptide/nickel transport system substrate-binding protein n=1 Tax=Streptoalloteichus tenebrarius (strain ATCC 17920 / DSM 40477 / JCM 4838 / CBS 697.72 / NBRC 16177 / NCIMB 11028 / NRRL B-12390 / A12253. 1 / ISP 5477) TaxID=1933 RepID=A0ABT1I354_STRSD|nr:ABC transporter family substrate-binding protein [Streptoalloteichus tenebrarius]MCP2262228.1 peptide/nickel transport system substrate-binding protein [Streptoalloteichus tenebrarius]BFF01093.1 ABC transporter family substrate-binding protein [Streptoalloteichus tenebrarius]